MEEKLICSMEKEMRRRGYSPMTIGAYLFYVKNARAKARDVFEHAQKSKGFLTYQAVFEEMRKRA